VEDDDHNLNSIKSPRWVWSLFFVVLLLLVAPLVMLVIALF
jgi:hypothetical protein